MSRYKKADKALEAQLNKGEELHPGLAADLIIEHRELRAELAKWKKKWLKTERNRVKLYAKNHIMRNGLALYAQGVKSPTIAAVVLRETGSAKTKRAALKHIAQHIKKFPKKDLTDPMGVRIINTLFKDLPPADYGRKDDV